MSVITETPAQAPAPGDTLAESSFSAVIHAPIETATSLRGASRSQRPNTSGVRRRTTRRRSRQRLTVGGCRSTSRSSAEA